MPFLRPGKARESLTWKSDTLAQAARQFMQAQGYAETTRSLQSGTVEDLFFVSASSTPLPPVRAEVKDTELGLHDSQLLREVWHHLNNWLALDLSSRFNFYLFVRKCSNQKEWENVFENCSWTAVRHWLSEDETETSEGALRTRQSEIMSFIARAYLVEADRDHLLLMAEDLAQTCLLGSLNWPGELKAQMDRRLAAGFTRDTLVSNLVALQLPSSFLTVEVSTTRFEDVWKRVGMWTVPPYTFIEKGRLLTLNYPEALETLAPIGPSDAEEIDTIAIVENYDHDLHRVLYQAIGRGATSKGAKISDDEFFFPSPNPGLRPGTFSVRGVSGRDVTLTSPLTLPVGDTEEERVAFGDLLSQRSAKTRLNFVKHVGFTFQVHDIWGAHYVSLVQRKIYTRDGISRIRGNAAKKIDARFRNPLFNRGPTQLTKLQAVTEYLFIGSKGWSRPPPKWWKCLRFDAVPGQGNPPEVSRPLLRVPTQWRPRDGFAEVGNLEESTLDEWEDGDEEPDEGNLGEDDIED